MREALWHWMAVHYKGTAVSFVCMTEYKVNDLFSLTPLGISILFTNFAHS